MTMIFRLAAVLALITLTTVMTLGQPADGDGVDVQTRGPIHEAFAQPTSPSPVESPVIAKKPPEPINELPPEQKPDGDHMIWIPGYWAFDDDQGDFLWVSGIWRDAPPDRNWIPGYWVAVEGGFRWTAGYWAGSNETSVELVPEPPDPVEEAIPPPPNANMSYVPGIWVYRETTFLWRPGYWIPAHPGWVWTPAHYCWTPLGYVYHSGFWDLDLHHRGICFAPIIVDQRFYGRPNWFYRPRHIVRTDFLLSALFVHVGFHQYFFGDYYDNAYVRRGYTPWVDYRVRGNAPDPLFSYYRWQNRANDRWEKDIRTVYTARRDDKTQRPPRTLVQQQKVVVNNNVQVTTSIENFKSSIVKLTPVSKEQAVEIRKNVEQFRSAAQQRAKIETDPKAKASSKSPKAPTVKIDLPKTAVKASAPKQKAPPVPEAPKITTKQPPPKELKIKNDDKKPKDLDKKPKDIDKLPKDLDKKLPKDLDKKPKVIDKLPKDLDKKTKEDDKLPKDLDKKPKEVEKKPKEVEKKPKEVEKKPKDSDKKPKDGDAKPKDKDKKDKDDGVNLQPLLNQATARFEVGRLSRMVLDRKDASG